MQAGQKVGSYQIIRPLDREKHGAVYLARQTEKGVEVAVKVLDAEMSEDASAVKAFRSDMETLSSLASPTIVNVYEVGNTPEGRIYMVMELLSGQTLRQRIEGEGPLDADSTRQFLFPLLDALETSHGARVIHGELDPDSVFLHRGPDGELVPRILRAGLYRLTEAYRRARRFSAARGDKAESSPFAAPELARGGVGTGVNADIFSLGALCSYMLTGCAPGSSDVVSGVASSLAGSSSGGTGLPKPLDDVIRKATSELTVARYADIKSLRGDLKEAWSGLGGAAEELHAPSRSAQRVSSAGSRRSSSARSDAVRARPLARPSAPAAARPSPAPRPASTPRTQAKSRSVLLIVLVIAVLNVGGVMAYMMFASGGSSRTSSRARRAARTHPVRVPTYNETVGVSGSSKPVRVKLPSETETLERASRARDLLLEVQKALRRKELDRAMALARKAHALQPSVPLAKMIGLTGCMTKRPEMAGWALSKLTGDDRKYVERVCIKEGVVPLLPDEGAAGSEPSRADVVQQSTLSPAQIRKYIRQSVVRVRRCFERSELKGIARAKIEIRGATGRVSSVEISGKFAGTRTGRCIARAPRRVRFPRFGKESVTAVFPFVHH